MVGSDLLIVVGIQAETGSADEHITGRVQKELLLEEGTGWTAGHGGAPFPVRDAAILTVLSLGSREAPELRRGRPQAGRGPAALLGSPSVNQRSRFQDAQSEQRGPESHLERSQVHSFHLEHEVP